MKYVPVKFTVPFHVYNIGDIAGFPRERADALVKSKVAVEYSPAPVAKPVPDLDKAFAELEAAPVPEPVVAADKPKKATKAAKPKKVVADDETF